jgi:hypothetical protein
MRRDLKLLILMYLGFVFVKSLLSYFVGSPSIFIDEYAYAKIAREFFFDGTLTLHGLIPAKYPPLYAMILSISYLFNDMNVIYFVMKIINVLLSSLVIFPIYFLAREFLDSKKSLFIAFLVSLFAANFNSANYIVAENLFYPLFLFTVLFIYLAFKTSEKKFFILSGVFLSLTYLTKILGTVLVPLVFLLFIIKFKETKFYNVLLHYFVAMLCVAPQLIKHVMQNGMSVYGVLGGYSGPTMVVQSFSTKIISFLDWIILYSGYAILATGVLFGLFFIYGWFVKDKKFKLFYLVILLVVLLNLLVVANQSNMNNGVYDSPFGDLFTGRVIGRYFDASVSLIFLVGFIVFERYKIHKKLLGKVAIFTSLILFVASQLTLMPLFPFNNQSLTLLGVLQSGLEYVFYGEVFFGSVFHWLPYLIILIIFAMLPFLIYKLRNKKKFLVFLVLLFVLANSILAYGVMSWNTNSYWADNSQKDLGQWFNEYDLGASSVLLDEDYCELRTQKDNLEISFCPHLGTPLAFWMNNDIAIGNSSEISGFDYLVSMNTNLDYEVLKQEGGFIIYKV